MEKDRTRPFVAYHYYRDRNDQPKIVIARVVEANGGVGYGWAILGRGDIFHSKDYVICRDGIEERCRGGHRIARERAVCAIGNPKRGVQIADNVWRYKRPISSPYAMDVIRATEAFGLLSLVDCNAWYGLPSDMHAPQETTDAASQVP